MDGTGIGSTSRPSRPRRKIVSCVDFVPRISRKFQAPRHLARLGNAFDRAIAGESVRAVNWAPPRHGKTELLLHFIVLYLLANPTKRVAYVTYGQNLTRAKARLARLYAQAAGVELAVTNLGEWLTPEGGGVLFTSITGSFVGMGCDVLLIDDPYKNRAQAESLVIRDAVYDWFRGVANNRVEPNGSIFVSHTRWHLDDLIGRILADFEAGDGPEFEIIDHMALGGPGEDVPLWPERWTREALEKIKLASGAYDWEALYQGRPRPKGGKLFTGVSWYDPSKFDLTQGYKISVGVDLAYSGKTSSHYSVAVVLAIPTGSDPLKAPIYVLDVVRVQEKLPKFMARLRGLDAKYPFADWLWYTSSTEKGTADLIRQEAGFWLDGEIAASDKYVRAQPVSAGWPRIHLPRVPGAAAIEWVGPFVREVTEFTGVRDKYDDQVDALAAAYDVLVRGRLGALNSSQMRAPQKTQFTDFGNPYQRAPAEVSRGDLEKLHGENRKRGGFEL